MIYPHRKKPRFDEGLDDINVVKEQYYGQGATNYDGTDPRLEAASLAYLRQEQERALQKQMEDEMYDDSFVKNYTDKMMSKPIKKPIIRRRNSGSGSGRGVVTTPTGGSVSKGVSGSRGSVVTGGRSTGTSTKVTSDQILKEMNDAYKKGGEKAAQIVYNGYMRENSTAASAALDAYNYEHKQKTYKNKDVKLKSGIVLKSNPNVRKRYDVDGGTLDELVVTGNKTKSDVKQTLNRRSVSKSSNASSRTITNAGVGPYRSSAYGKTRHDRAVEQRRKQNQAARIRYIRAGKTTTKKANRAFWGGLASLLGFKPY